MNRDKNQKSLRLASLLAGLTLLGAAAGCSSKADAAGDNGGGDDSSSKDAGKSTKDAGKDSGKSTPVSDDTDVGDDSTDTDSGPTDTDAAPTDTDGGSEAGTDTDGGPNPSPDAGPTSSCPASGIKPSQVVMIGDSYLDDNWSFTGQKIMDNARKAGKLGANDSYRHYYVGGTQMVGGAIGPAIPQQYENAKAADKDIKVLILDGGGNDILIGNRDCLTNPPPGNASCVATIKGVIDQAKKSLAEAAADGVKNIIYMFYAHLDPAGGGLLPMPAPGVNPTLDYAIPLAKAVCQETSTVPCYFVDNSHLFDNQWSTLIKPDHIHPLPPAAQMLADGVWKTMQDHCIAQ